MDQVFKDEYKMIKQLARGRSSCIYQAVSIKNGKSYAGKLQQSSKSDSVLREATILINIQQQYQIVVDYGIVRCHYAGKQANNNVLFTDLLSQSLQSLLGKCGGIFKMKTFLMLADQMLKRIQFLHHNQYIHRDISLKKFVMGKDSNIKKLYLCGMGKGKRYIKQGQHIKYQNVKSRCNPLYMSINCHLEQQQSRRDDLQSIVYCWAEMLYGRLPWSEEPNLQRILSKKIENRGEILFKNLPIQLQEICNYARNLSFAEQIDYQKLRCWILELFSHFKLQYDYEYDWEFI